MFEFEVILQFFCFLDDFFIFFNDVQDFVVGYLGFFNEEVVVFEFDKFDWYFFFFIISFFVFDDNVVVFFFFLWVVFYFCQYFFNGVFFYGSYFKIFFKFFFQFFMQLLCFGKLKLMLNLVNFFRFFLSVQLFLVGRFVLLIVFLKIVLFVNMILCFLLLR